MVDELDSHILKHAIITLFRSFIVTFCLAFGDKISFRLLDLCMIMAMASGNIRMELGGWNGLCRCPFMKRVLAMPTLYSSYYQPEYRDLYEGVSRYSSA